ncbi:MAG TPA: nuclear transport factor 2 family protein [Nostocaceae cyanobacterium]|nr:nuclear transport factor 2 family protein [Nostocaceae cyanobacterium]
MSDIEIINTVSRLIEDYFWGWQYENWEQVRGTLSADVRFEDPKLGCFDGIDTHIDLYANSQRFPNLKGVSPRRVANNQDVGFLSYDVYLGHERVATVMDQLTVREGKIVYVLSVMSEWPEGYPDLSNIST